MDGRSDADYPDARRQQRRAQGRCGIGEVVVELGGACAGCGISNITAQNIQSDLIMTFDEITDVQVKVPSSGDHGSSTVEGGRGGELQ